MSPRLAVNAKDKKKKKKSNNKQRKKGKALKQKEGKDIKTTISLSLLFWKIFPCLSGGRGVFCSARIPQKVETAC